MQRSRPHLRALACLLACPAVCDAATTISNPFQGITWYHREDTFPRTLVINIVEVDLTFPGISFTTTPSNGTDPLDVNAQYTKDFVTQVGAQIGINGDFYSPLSGINRDLVHLNMSNGTQVSPWSGSGSTKEGALNITSGNIASIVRPANVNNADYKVTPTSTLYIAVGGNERLIQSGSVIATDTTLNPRTAVGVNGTHLFLATIDGRETGVSEGMSTIEVANMLKNDYGCTDALNLDGGGSTTLVFADPTARTINQPSDGTDRFVANNFAVFAPLWPQWIKNGDGNWNTPGNWAGAIPNGVDKSADFKSAITAAHTITLDVPVTLGTLNLVNSFSYNFAGANAMTFDVTSGSAAINVTSGSHSITAPVTINDPINLNVSGGLTLATINNPNSKSITKTGTGSWTVTGAQTHGPATVIDLNGGPVSFAGAITAGFGTTLNVNSSTLTLSGPLSFSSGCNLNVNSGLVNLNTTLNPVVRNVSVNVSGGGLALTSTQRFPNLNVSGNGVVSVQYFGNRIINTKTLAITGSGKVDLSNNHLIVDYDNPNASPLTSVTAMIASAYNGGTWNGPGLGSSTALGDGKSLGIAEAADVKGLSGSQTTTFGTETLDATTVMVKSTWPGDANLDLKLDIDDYFRIDYGYANGLGAWAWGDFNYDGHVTAADYAILDNAYEKLNGFAPTGLGLPRDSILPEPTIFGTFAFAPLVFRRRKRS